MTRRHVHVSGVAGVGMNAVAQLLLSDGVRVTGSDRFRDQGVLVPVLAALAAQGVELLPQDGSAITRETEALVISTAVETDNPERRRAKRLGVPERHRSEVLAGFTGRGPLAAVAGTSGKTTCTGWLGWVLEACGKDPNLVNGGGITSWKTPTHPGNVRRGAPGNWWVAEVDESDRSLLRFTPRVALINTMTVDHHGWEETVALFREFAGKVTDTVVCGPGVAGHLGPVPARVVELRTPMDVPLPGDHNRWNAAAVLAMAEACGCDTETARAAIRTFPGVERRLERCSPPGRVPRVFDDYAHNPEKLAAAIRAVHLDPGRTAVVWRPHGFAPLRQNLSAYADAFTEAVREGDVIWILPVFYAGGTAPRDVDHTDLVCEIRNRGVTAHALEAYPGPDRFRGFDTILVAGARDPGLPGFARSLSRTP